jgi:hypothetical protein
VIIFNKEAGLEVALAKSFSKNAFKTFSLLTLIEIMRQVRTLQISKPVKNRISIWRSLRQIISLKAKFKCFEKEKIIAFLIEHMSTKSYQSLLVSGDTI